MKNVTKLLALIMVLAMVLCMAACGEGTPSNTEDTTANNTNTTTAPATGDSEPVSQPVDDGKETYIINLQDSQGNPLAGVLVNICKEGGMCFVPVSTDENGCATYSLESASDYYGSVTTDPSSKVYFADKFEVTIVWDAPVEE